MSEVREGAEDDEELKSQTDSNDTPDDDRPFIPGADAGTTQADRYSRDEKEHGRQDHGP
jgi:hypothetical protein